MSVLVAPAYLALLPPGSAPTNDLDEFLALLAQRMAMIKRGGELDLARAEVYFVRWWRGEVGSLATDHALPAAPGTQAWGFDFQWEAPAHTPGAEGNFALEVQARMEEGIERYVLETDREEAEENNVSETQIKKRAVKEEKERRKLKNMSKRQ